MQLRPTHTAGAMEITVWLMMNKVTRMKEVLRMTTLTSAITLTPTVTNMSMLKMMNLIMPTEITAKQVTAK